MKSQSETIISESVVPLLVTEAIDKIMIGGDDIAQDDFIIHKLLDRLYENTKVCFLMLVQLFS